MRTPEEITHALTENGSALICMHVGPDGDTLGASLALAQAMRAMGKRVRVICADPVPELYSFLPCVPMVELPRAVADQRFDMAVAVDVSDYARLGDAQAAFDAAPCRVVIDHHPTNDRFGTVNWIEPAAAATGVMVQACIDALGIELTHEMADCLYTAISTDTGNFCFPNTNAEAFYAAAELLDAGAHVADLTRRIYRTRSRPSVELLARALSTLEFRAGERIATLTLCAKDFAETGAAESMTEGVVNYAIEIVGVQMAALARENGAGVKFSLRARAPHDVSRIAKRFGGGGHALAAGCTLPFPLEDAVRSVGDAMEEALGEGMVPH